MCATGAASLLSGYEGLADGAVRTGRYRPAGREPVTQALLLALAGSFYPVGLLFVLRYLAATRGLFVANLFLVGGALGCALVSTVELLLLDALPLDRQDDPVASGSVYIVLGAGLVIVCIIFARRGQRAARVTEPKASADPSLARAFVTGLIVYSPGVDSSQR